MAGSFNHLVVLMLENRSFDHMLGRLYHHDNPAPYHIVPRGQTFNGVADNMFNSITPIAAPDSPDAIHVSRATRYDTPHDYDIGHSFTDVRLQIDGLLPPLTHMNGFVASRASNLAADGHPTTPSSPQLKDVMAGFSPTEHTTDGRGPFAETRVINTLARNFAVCDNWPASVPGQSIAERCLSGAFETDGQ